MRIEDLKDPRDRAACEWAARAESVHTQPFVHQPKTDDKPEAKTLVACIKYDETAEAEFQKGL